MFRARPGDFLVFESSTLERRPSTSRSKLSSINIRPLSPKPCTTTCVPITSEPHSPSLFENAQDRNDPNIPSTTESRDTPRIPHPVVFPSRSSSLFRVPKFSNSGPRSRTPSSSPRARDQDHFPIRNDRSHDCNAARETGAPVCFRTPYASPFPMRPLV